MRKASPSAIHPDGTIQNIDAAGRGDVSRGAAAVGPVPGGDSAAIIPR